MGDAWAGAILEIPAARWPTGDSTDGYVKVWTGSEWVSYPMKVWNGTDWEIKPVKWWDGTSWLSS